MNYEIVYDIDYSALYEIVNKLQERYLQRLDKQGSYLREAVHVAGDYVAQEWVNVAASKFKHSQGGYARGIVDGTKYPFQGDPLFYKIIHQSPYAKYLEDGFAPFDMKKALQTSDKIRITKDGKRYLIIPFEHGTPTSKSKRAMPQEIYAEAKRLKPSIVASKFNEGSIRGAVTQNDADMLRRLNPKQIQRNTYEWGEKLTRVKNIELEDDSIYKGMVRFEQNPNINREKFDLGKFGPSSGHNETSSMGRRGLYMTFRIMIEDSEGWAHPGLKAMGIRSETYDHTKQPVEMMLNEAAKKDVAKVLQNLT